MKLFFLWSCLLACRGSEKPLFRLLTPQQTGVTFANTITATDSFNVQTNVYIYNGAGVAVGDIDNDGLPDLFFSGNVVSSRLYRNLGGMRFEDITERAGVRTTSWATGASMVDINDDGYLDIYVSVTGPEKSRPEDRANLLFINNGNGTFTESASKYGLADTGFGTHAAFFDYDGDGDLDVFVLNNSPAGFGRSELALHPSRSDSLPPAASNQLYRNNGNGTFTNVSQNAGILRTTGYGLGVAIADLNRDGLPDIYVSNDIAPNDVVYVNNGNGTFTDRAAQWLKHTSRAGMGVDVADFNGDGWPDIVQVDMMPHALSDRKRMSGFETYGSLQDARARGLRVDYDINTLQLSNGVDSNRDVVFSEIGRMAGIAYTDWSWSALFADFDDDGRKDILITNGYPKAVNDFDYQTAAFAAQRRADTARARRLLRELRSYDVPNYVFRNDGDLTFSDRSKEWGFDQRGFSYGAAYADLNNDGKLDVVVNNINGPAYIYENVSGDDDSHHSLRVTLQGDSPNRRGIGATVIATVGRQKQFVYVTPYRGYMSTMDGPVHFGLGRGRRVDTLEIIWPDGRYQALANAQADTVLVMRQTDAHARRAVIPSTFAALSAGSARDLQVQIPHFARNDIRGLAYKQSSPAIVDYSVQSLLPYQLSAHGPALAVADVNGDGLDDVFVGGSRGVGGKLFLQNGDGSFTESLEGQPWSADKTYDDWGAVFFDANGDGRPDLYVASGGYQLSPASPLLQDRLYINQGGGRFVRDSTALPRMLTSTAAVRAGDFNGDGRLDLFVGGRLSPRNYPYPARSYVLRNDGGRFTDVTQEVAPELAQPVGMITDATWIDFDGDGKLDLVTVGEWLPIQFYRNDGRQLRNVTPSTGLPVARGWWFALAAGDFDNDGHPDLVAGNLGLNSAYTTSSQNPFGIYAADFTGAQNTDIVLTQKVNGVDVPLQGLVPLGREIYTLGVKFPTYASFAQMSMRQAFSAVQLEHALHYDADTFASVYLHNDGGGKFSLSPLPDLAQIAPIKSIVVRDVDGDGHLDLIVAGNLYETEANTPRADAGNGLWLRGDGRGRFVPIAPRESGFLAPLDVSGLALINGSALLVANSGDSLQVFSVRKAGGGRRD